MSDSPASGRTLEKRPSPDRRSWARRWFRRVVLALPVVFVLLLVSLFAARAYFRAIGQRALAAEMTRLDAEDPGWRFDDLMTAREKAAPSEDENSAVVVRRVRGLMPTEWNDWVTWQPAPAADAEPPPFNRRQRLEDLTRDAELAAATRPARDLGLTLRFHPRGYHVVTVEGILIKLDETIEARRVAHLMRTDAVLAAQEGDAVRGLRAAHAVLNTGRSIGDEPSLLSSIVHFACGTMAAEAAVRVLAITDPQNAAPELAALQVALEAELDEPVLVNGLRGERAVYDRFLGRVEDGALGADALARMGEMKPTSEGRVALYLRRGFIPEDHRRFLRFMSDFIAAAKGPPHERLRAAERVEAEIRADRDLRYPFHGILLPTVRKPIEASLQYRAELLSVTTLIACERFRLKHGRWPAALAELPKDLLPTVPIDPYNGEPMRFAKLDDGITVYSTGPGPNTDRNKQRRNNPLGGAELGWRLYDPNRRGLPPLPPAPEPDPAADPGAAP
ncbi:MAG: hypothetical protein J0I06_01335 [Planctomycetes bacterium]|nr:hypothetical protein [Planctomycetota bacterium]